VGIKTLIQAVYSDDQEIWDNIIGQRIFSGRNFDWTTESYMESFGLFEIIIKTITFSFFVGACIFIWKNLKTVRSLDMGVHNAKKSKFDKYWSFHSYYYQDKRFNNFLLQNTVGDQKADHGIHDTGLFNPQLHHLFHQRERFWT
jgi:hypothetical protein